MGDMGLERLRESHHSILERLKDNQQLTVSNAKDLSATSTLIRWGVLDAVDTPSGRVAWKRAFDLKNRREVRLVEKVYIRGAVPLRDAPPKTTIELLERGLIEKDSSSAGCVIRLKCQFPVVVILRDSVYSFGIDQGM